MIELYPKQEQAVEKMVSLLSSTEDYKVCLNTSMTGTGKTLQALETAKRLSLPFIVIAPLSAHATWRVWSEEFKVTPMAVINIEKLRTGNTPYLSKKGTKKHTVYKWDLPEHTMVIIDEVHRGCAGHKTQTSKIVAMLRVQRIPCLMMSATPFGSPLNMRALGYLLGLHNYDASGFYRWCKANGCTKSPFHNGYEFPLGPRGNKYLGIINHQIRDRIVKLTTTDLSDHFGENIIQPELISLGTRPVAEIDKIYEEMDGRIKEHPANKLVEMLRARQKVELYKVPVIAEHVEDLVNQGLSVFVALSFRDSVEALNDTLEEMGLSPALIIGGQSEAERSMMVDMFNSDLVRVIICTIEAGGVALSLHQVREDQHPRASIITPNFKADTFLQALGRIYRAGGLSPALQKIMLAEDTVEEGIYKTLIQKLNNIETLSDSDLEGTI